MCIVFMEKDEKAVKAWNVVSVHSSLRQASFSWYFVPAQFFVFICLLPQRLEAGKGSFWSQLQAANGRDNHISR